MVLYSLLSVANLLHNQQNPKLAHEIIEMIFRAY